MKQLSVLLIVAIIVMVSMNAAVFAFDSDGIMSFDNPGSSDQKYGGFTGVPSAYVSVYASLSSYPYDTTSYVYAIAGYYDVVEAYCSNPAPDYNITDSQSALMYTSTVNYALEYYCGEYPAVGLNASVTVDWNR